MGWLLALLRAIPALVEGVGRLLDALATASAARSKAAKDKRNAQAIAEAQKALDRPKDQP